MTDTYDDFRRDTLPVLLKRAISELGEGTGVTELLVHACYLQHSDSRPQKTRGRPALTEAEKDANACFALDCVARCMRETGCGVEEAILTVQEDITDRTLKYTGPRISDGKIRQARARLPSIWKHLKAQAKNMQ